MLNRSVRNCLVPFLLLAIISIAATMAIVYHLYKIGGCSTYTEANTYTMRDVLSAVKSKLGVSINKCLNKVPSTPGTSSYPMFTRRGQPQDDPELINYIRKFHLTEPSKKPYALDKYKNPRKNPSEFGSILMQLFKRKRKGFFIEAGANDGEYLSNTLQLEREYKWTGLLIEPNPFMQVKLRLRNRRAWVAGVCLSLEGYPDKIRFMHRVGVKAHTTGMGIIEHSKDNPVPPTTKRNPKNYVYAGPVECFPLYSLLLVVNQTVVDYFSLDIEGVELRVLKAIPFERVTIKVFSIEYNLVPEGEFALRSFLETKGYVIFLKRKVELFAVHRDFAHEFGINWNQYII